MQKTRVQITLSPELENGINEMIRRVEESKGPRLSFAQCLEHFALLGVHAYLEGPFVIYEAHKDISKKIRSRKEENAE